jgi:hypothetical protein
MVGELGDTGGVVMTVSIKCGESRGVRSYLVSELSAELCQF